MGRIFSAEDVRKILRKLSTLLNKESRKRLDFSIISKKYGDWNREPDPSLLDTIIKAFSNHCVIEIVYYSPEKEKLSRRKVSIYAQNARYMVGYCHLAKDMRKFRKSRIVSAKILKENYTIPDDFNRKEFLR